MLLGSVPFVLYLRVARGSLRPVFADYQVRWFLSIVGVSVDLVALWLYHNELLDQLDALRLSPFTVTSATTGSGFAPDDYGRCGLLGMADMILRLFIGGGADSREG